MYWFPISPLDSEFLVPKDHSPSQYVLSIYYVPGPKVGARNSFRSWGRDMATALKELMVYIHGKALEWMFIPIPAEDPILNSPVR